MKPKLISVLSRSAVRLGWILSGLLAFAFLLYGEGDALLKLVDSEGRAIEARIIEVENDAVTIERSDGRRFYEWLKNRAGVSFDRMTARHEELTKQELVRMVEELCGNQLSPERTAQVTTRPDERTLVNAASRKSQAKLRFSVQLECLLLAVIAIEIHSPSTGLRAERQESRQQPPP